MKNSVLFIFAVSLFGFAISGCRQNNQSYSEEDFLGEWYTIRGDVEAYSFLKDSNNYIFVGTENMRPVVFGTWKIEKDKFNIIMDDGTKNSYSFVLSNDTLVFNKGEEIYTRTTPVEVLYPEARILIKISGDFSTLGFSAPSPSDLNWGFRTNNKNERRNYTLKGFSIASPKPVSSGYFDEISEYLKDSGYEPDTLYSSDLCKGFIDYDQIVTLCSDKVPHSLKDSVYIRITSGFIVK